MHGWDEYDGIGVLNNLKISYFWIVFHVLEVGEHIVV